MVVEQKINESSATLRQQQTVAQDTTTCETIGQRLVKTTSASTTGKALRSVLLRAKFESRLVVGLSAAIDQLSRQPANTMFCVVVSPQKQDSGNHLQKVLLNAFCFENDIYMVQVENSDKLRRLINTPNCTSCVLVQMPTGRANSSSEEALVDYCEEHWDAPTQPLVQLPE